MPEQLIGRYKIEGLLGRGAMGVVYKAYDPILDRYAAIKLMSTSGELDDELRARFFREARSAARLTNPNIIGIYDMGEDKDRPFIAMEYVEGEDLKHLIKQRAFLSFEKKLRFIIQICDALYYAHLHGVVHRDIKPGNIRITRLGEVKILDFGLARLESSEMTRTGMLMGTPYYMSPEQAKGAREIDGRSDLFSVGVILYELISYHRPFEGETPATVCFQIIREPHLPISTYLPHCDPELEAIIDKALAKNPSDRFEDCGQMGAALTRFSEVLPSRRAQLLQDIKAVEAAIEAALEKAGITDRAGLDRMALNEATIARPVGMEAASVDQSTMLSPPEREDYGSLLIRLSNANRQLDALKDNLAKFRDFQEAYRATRDLFEKRDWQACLGNLDKIQADFPVTPEMLSMRSACLKELEKAEAERQKQSQVEAALSAARAAWERGNLEACVKACQMVLSIAPDCLEAAELKQQVTHRLERSKRLAELESAAQHAWSQGDYEACAKAAEEALELEPENEDLGRLRSRARQALNQQKESARLLKAVRDQLDQKDYSAALASCEQLRSLGVEEKAIDRFRKEALLGQERESRLRSLWDAAGKAQEHQDLEKQERLAGEILAIDPENVQAKQLRETAQAALARRRQARELLDQAVALFKEREYQKAVSLAEQAIALDPELKEAVDVRQSIEERVREEQKQRELLDAARASWEAENYAAARKTLQAVTALDGESQEARDLANRIAETEKELNRAARLLSEKKYGGAVEAAAAVLRLQPAQSQALRIQKEAEAGLDLNVRIARAREKAAGLAANGHDEEVIAVCEEGLALDPDDQELNRLIEQSRANLERQSRIQGFLAESEACFADGNWEGAIEAADKVLELDGGNAKARDLRQRATEQAERAKRLAALLERAREAHAGELWDEAQATASEALQLEPNDSELLEIRAEAVARIEKNKKLAAILAEARKELKSSKFEEAVSLAERALALDAGNREAATVRQSAQRSIDDARERKSRIDGFLAESEACFADGNWEGAIEAADKVLDLDGGNAKARDLRQRATEQAERAKRLAALLERAREARAGESWDEAQAAASEALQLEPNDSELLEIRAEAVARIEKNKKLAAILAEAQKELKSSKFEEAVSLAEQALALDAGNREAATVKQSAQRSIDDARERKSRIDGFLADSEACFAEGKWEGAIEAADKVLELDSGNVKAQDLRQRATERAARAKRLAALLERAREARSGESWDEAQAAASEALQLEPNDSELLEIRAEAVARIEKNKKLTAILAEARKELKSSKFEEAVSLAEQALALDAGNREAATVRQAAQRSIDDARKKAEAARQKAVEAAKSAARSYLQNGEYAKCIEACDQGLAMTTSDKTLEELRAKAERAIRERAEKLQEALVRGRKALAAGRIDDALQAAALARQIDPGAASVGELEQAAGRAQAEIERRAKLEKLLVAARAAKKEDDAETCSRMAREGLGVDPANAELQELQRWAAAVLEAARVERERRDKIATSWKAARSAIKRGKYRTALRNLDVVLGLDAKNREAATARQEVLQAAAVQRSKRLKLAYYAGAGVLSLSVAIFGILPVVSTHQTDPAPTPPVKQMTGEDKPAEKSQPPIQPPPAPQVSNPKEDPAAGLPKLIARASRSLRDKDYPTASALAQQALALSGNSAEARRIQQAAEKSLVDIAAGKRQVRSLISEGKPDEALRRLNAVLQLAPGDTEAAELATRLNTLSAAVGTADKARAEMGQAKARAQTSAADFPNLLEKAGQAESEAGNLYKNRQFGAAAAKFYQARDAYVSAEVQATDRVRQRRLEAVRQPAVQAQQSYDQSRRKAIAAGAEQSASDALRESDAKAGDARRKLDSGDFSGAQQDFRSAARLADEAADAAAKAQERTRIEQDGREVALRQARTNAEQARRRLDTAKASIGTQDPEAASEEAKGVSLLQQGMFDEAAVAFDRSLRRYQVLGQDRENIKNVVSAFSKAYSGRDLRALKELWPGIDSDTERVFKATFEASRSLDLSLQASDIDINQDSAVATGSGKLRVTPISGKQLESESSSVRFQLARNGSSWTIRSYRFSAAK